MILSQKPQGGDKFLVQILGGARGGWLWMKLIPAFMMPHSGEGLSIFTDIDVVQSSLSKIIMPIILRTEFRYLFRRWLFLFRIRLSKQGQKELTLQAYHLTCSERVNSSKEG